MHPCHYRARDGDVPDASLESGVTAVANRWLLCRAHSGSAASAGNGRVASRKSQIANRKLQQSRAGRAVTGQTCVDSSLLFHWRWPSAGGISSRNTPVSSLRGSHALTSCDPPQPANCWRNTTLTSSPASCNRLRLRKPPMSSYGGVFYEECMQLLVSQFEVASLGRWLVDAQ